MKKQLFFVMMFVLAFTQCSKDQNTNTPSNIDLLTSGPWALERLQYDPPFDFEGKGQKVSDAYQFIPDCQRDNSIYFRKPDVLEFNEEATKCQPQYEQQEFGTWRMISDKDVETKHKSSTDTLRIESGKLIYVDVFPYYFHNNPVEYITETQTFKLR